MTAALRQLLQGSGDRVVYVGPTGRIISNDPIATSVATAVDLQLVLNGSTVQGTVAIPRGTFVYVAQPVPGRRPNGVAGVVLARPVALAATVWRPVIGRVLLAGAVAVLVAVAVSLWIARRLAQPLRTMAEATHNLAAGDLAHRVPVEGNDEVADLARQFNDMAWALAEAAGASTSSSQTSRTSSAHHSPPSGATSRRSGTARLPTRVPGPTPSGSSATRRPAWSCSWATSWTWPGWGRRSSGWNPVRRPSMPSWARRWRHTQPERPTPASPWSTAATPA